MKKLATRVMFAVLLLTTIVVLFTACKHEHEYGAWTVEKNVSCVENGVEVRLCECGEKELRDIPKIEHTPITDAAVAPTCTETGLTEGKHCSVCDAVLVEQEVVAANGHSYGKELMLKEVKFFANQVQSTHTQNSMLKFMPL